ncbi:retrotransposon protein, putative, ty1-copia subclass [Tanacetum coccineum]
MYMFQNLRNSDITRPSGSDQVSKSKELQEQTIFKLSRSRKISIMNKKVKNATNEKNATKNATNEKNATSVKKTTNEKNATSVKNATNFKREFVPWTSEMDDAYIRAMLKEKDKVQDQKDYALKSAAHILNMVPTKKVDKTPYKVWHGQAPKLSYLKVWGCEALVKRDILTKPYKLDSRSIKYIFIGYPKEMMGYSFYYLPENKIFVAHNAEFLENSLINCESSRSLDDLEMIQDEDTHPSLDTSLNHKEDDQEIDEPQSDINPICRFTRTRRPTYRLCLYVNAEEHELGDLDEPANYKAALLDSESDK